MNLWVVTNIQKSNMIATLFGSVVPSIVIHAECERGDEISSGIPNTHRDTGKQALQPERKTSDKKPGTWRRREGHERAFFPSTPHSNSQLAHNAKSAERGEI